MAKKHIATYPMYRTHPLTGRVLTGTRNRIGTGYLYSVEDIEKQREHLAKYDHPLHIRWRNEECRIAALQAHPSTTPEDKG